MIVRLLALSSVLTVCVFAEPSMVTWHVLDTPIRLNDRLELTLHQRARTQEGRLEQLRSGGIIRWKAFPKATLLTGYYFQPQHPSDEPWVKGQRLFSGIETSGRLTARAQWSGRLAAERFFSAGRPDYMRYRTNLRLMIGRGSVKPYVQNDMLAVRQGFHSMRNGGGLRVSFSTQFTVETGVLYDIRRTVWGGDRFAVVTSITYHHGAKDQ